jgi:transcriptional regulator with XRE-family HTH domain
VKRAEDREVVRVLVQVLRALRNWDQTELGRAAGHDAAAISKYESGAKTPRYATLERLAAAVGVPMRTVETVLLPILRQVLAQLPPRAGGTPMGDAGPAGAGTRQGDVALASALHEAVASGLAMAAGELGRLEAEGKSASAVPRAADRLKGAELWERLEPCSAQERRWLIERLPEFQTWSLAERLGSESARAAADDATVALELAQLGLQVAELCRGEERWRKRLQGLCRAFLANARRVQGELRSAEREIAGARQLWDEGEGGDPGGLLGGWRLDDLEGSLRRAP